MNTLAFKLSKEERDVLMYALCAYEPFDACEHDVLKTLRAKMREELAEKKEMRHG